MLAFFDTSIHIDILRGTRPLADILGAVGNPPVRLSPVVASELLRGVSGRGIRSVMRLVRALVPLEPPSWRACWLETGRLLPRVFPDHEAIGLARLQNDGNVIYGLGPTLLEEIIFDGGQVTNPNLSDYMIPSFRDAPLELSSVSLESEGSHGAIHGIGEMTLPPVAPAIANAIEDAVGVRIKGLPITAEKVLRALREKAG